MEPLISMVQLMNNPPSARTGLRRALAATLALSFLLSGPIGFGSTVAYAQSDDIKEATADSATPTPSSSDGALAAASTAPAEKPAQTEPASGIASSGAKLFGRIEQIAGEADVKMPVLKSQTAKLDTRDPRLKARANETLYTGSVAKAFPEDYQGNWGGQMEVWSYHYSPAYLQLDRNEAARTAQLLKKGRKGNVNFHFYRTANGQTALEPAKVLLSIPLKDASGFQEQMGQLGNNPLMGGMFSQMMGNMEQPILQIYFGNAQTSAMERGVSGNDFRAVLYKNVIRTLAPGVLEQQILTRSETTVKGSGAVNRGYEESVLRFKRLDANRFYVLAASVRYTESGQYLSKLIMYGTVTKGQKVQTNPYAGVNDMMKQMMGGSGHGTSGTGGFPFGGGGSPGGSSGGSPGGLNLNDLMKQLQQGGR